LDATTGALVIFLQRWDEKAGLKTTDPELRRWFSKLPPGVVALEAGGHSRWMSKLLVE
jgi:hypothetical protein